MQGVLGKSPLAYFQDLRTERAVHLFKTSHASVDQIAAEVGYAEGVSLLRRRPGRACVKSAAASEAGSPAQPPLFEDVETICSISAPRADWRR